MLWMSTQSSLPRLSDAEKERIKAEYRAANGGGADPTEMVDPLSPGRRSGGFAFDWQRICDRRMRRYEERFGRPYDPAEELPEYECAQCHDTGRYLLSRGEARSWHNCECGIGQAWPEWNTDAARVPMALRRRYTVWTPDQAAWDAGQAWLASWPPSEAFFTMLGRPGNGKSNMAACMLAQIHEQHRQRVAFSGVVEILDRLKATFDDDARTETTETVMAECIGQQVLCIDDLGSAKPTDWAEERLYAIIDGRLKAERPTIITCNPSGAGWDGLHPRLKSRVRAGVTVELTGPDRRLRRTG